MEDVGGDNSTPATEHEWFLLLDHLAGFFNPSTRIRTDADFAQGYVRAAKSLQREERLRERTQSHEANLEVERAVNEFLPDLAENLSDLVDAANEAYYKKSYVALRHLSVGIRHLLNKGFYGEPFDEETMERLLYSQDIHDRAAGTLMRVASQLGGLELSDIWRKVATDDMLRQQAQFDQFAEQNPRYFGSNRLQERHDLFNPPSNSER